MFRREPRSKRSSSRRAAFVPAVSLTALLGLGALAAAPATGTAGAAPQPTKVVLTNASNGTTTIATKGEEVVVQLASNGYRWTEASVMNASANVVLQKLSGHVYANGSSTTTFLVVGYGLASLQAVGNPKCAASGCLLPSILWSANIASPVVDPPGPAAG